MRSAQRDILSLKYLPWEASICGHFAAQGGMIPKQHVPDLIRDVKRFSDKIMPRKATAARRLRCHQVNPSRAAHS
jgi:hypothetical protein